MSEKWKRRRTQASVMVDVDLDEFDADQLLQALIQAELLTEEEAMAILARGKKNFVPHEQIVKPDESAVELEDAREELLRGRKREALIHIERALGPRWIGSFSS